MDRGLGDKLYCIGRQKLRIEEASRYAKPRWIPVLDNQYKMKKMNRAKMLVQITTNVKPPTPEVMEEIEKNMVEWNTVKQTLDTGDLILFSKLGWQQSLMDTKAKRQWSHIGMIINIPQYKFLLMWELCFPFDGVQAMNLPQTYTFEDFPLFINNIYKSERLRSLMREETNEKAEESKQEKMEKVERVEMKEEEKIDNDKGKEEIENKSKGVIVDSNVSTPDTFKKEDLEIQDVQNFEKEEEDTSSEGEQGEEEEGEKRTSLAIKYDLRLSELSDAVQNKEFARVAVRKLKVERSQDMLRSLMEFRKTTNTPEWDLRLKHKIFSFHRKLAHSKDFIAASASTDELFCADLIFSAYQAMGIISEKNSEEEIHTPDDFASKSFAFELTRGELEKEVWVSRKFNHVSQKYDL